MSDAAPTIPSATPSPGGSTPSGTAGYMTPANVPNNRQEMKPLPLRVATMQYERLCKARDRTGISIQEHVRRAIDIYLAQIEREAIELGQIPSQTQQIANAKPRALRATPASGMPRVQKR